MDKVTTAWDRGRLVSEDPRRVSLSWGSGVASGAAEGTLDVPSTARSSLVCWTHPEWVRRFPWLVQGTTGRSPGEREGDFRLFGPDGRPEQNPNWLDLAKGLGFTGVSYTRQVHGEGILAHREPGFGLSIGPAADGQITSAPGALMAVTVADCVPVFLVDPDRRTVALLHAGWRGVVAGILEAGISLLLQHSRGTEGDILVHLGPAICGTCYEVGPEVHAALGLSRPRKPSPVDLRGVLAERAVGAGILDSHVTRSSFCTLCSGSLFFSHRGREAKRQVGFLGIRPS